MIPHKAHEMNSILTKLHQHYLQIKSLHMQQLFAEDTQRFKKFSLTAAGLLLDYSKNRITEDTLQELVTFADATNLSAYIEDLFTGKPVNTTEQRPALHTALRDPNESPLYVDNMNIKEGIKKSLALMAHWVEKLHTRQWLGYSGKSITDVVHIGIGGSHLGPLMVCEALPPVKESPCHYFVSNLDPAELDGLLPQLNPETTLFIIASKMFTTQETLSIATRAKSWLAAHANKKNISQQLLAATAHIENAVTYGIAPDLILPSWDWVGGRFSLWSAAIGLVIALKAGVPQFQALLQGAHTMDQHFRTAPFNANMPVILGLLSFWYIHCFKATAQAALPYDYGLRSLPRYLQQLEMESNGKHLQKNGQPVDGLTAPVLLGEVGTNGQHSFHQLLFQGTHLIPCDFIATINGVASSTDHAELLAHCLAQSRDLMQGKSAEVFYEELIQNGYHPHDAKTLAAHKAIPGNQPSNTLLIDQLTPHTLGALLALYEHKVFVQGVLWNINSFDQWGVALGKETAQEIYKDLTQEKIDRGKYDSSTTGLLNHISSSNRNRG